MITRDTIITKIKECLEPLSYIYAMWLEGADANNMVDEYSDIDFWVDFEDEYEEQIYEKVETALSEISEIDYKHIIKHPYPKIKQRIYHLAGTSEYLMIDFCWQLHSRSREEYKYIKGSIVESAKVIFDKDNIIRFVNEDLSDYEHCNKLRLEECRYRFSQHYRVRKYVKREQYLEAYAYYNRYILESLVSILRLIYTPLNADYYLIHIFHHIPKGEYEKLKYFAQIASLNHIDERISLAEKWFNELCSIYEKQNK